MARARVQLDLLGPVVGGEIPAAYYPGFLSLEEADRLFVSSLVDCRWQHNEIKMFGRGIMLPRLEAIYGGHDYQYSGVLLKSLPWSDVPFLAELRDRIESLTGFSFDLVIGNQYRSGSDHIGYHADDDKSLGPNPAIASVSLGATRKFQIRPNGKGTQAVTWELRHGDLIVMLPGCQQDFKHRICKTSAPTGVRVNWTFRPHVETR